MGDNGAGPYPTLAEETRILALHGSETPPRDAGVPEPTQHTVSSWPPSNASIAANVTGNPTTSTAPITINRIPSLNPARVPKPRRNNSVRKNIPKNITKSAHPITASNKKRARSPSEETDEAGFDNEMYVARDTQSKSKTSRLDRFESASHQHTATVSSALSPLTNPASSTYSTALNRFFSNRLITRPLGAHTPQPEAVATSNEFIVDVRNIDKLRITLAEGFHATNPGSRVGHVNVPTQLFYEYRSSDDHMVHIEPIVRITDNDEPGQGPMLRRTADPAGYRNHGVLADLTVARFHSAIMSTQRHIATTDTPASTAAPDSRLPVNLRTGFQPINDARPQASAQPLLHRPVSSYEVSSGLNASSPPSATKTPRSASFKTPLTPENFKASRGMRVSPSRVVTDPGRAKPSSPNRNNETIASPILNNGTHNPDAPHEANVPSDHQGLPYVPTSLSSDLPHVFDNGEEGMGV
jgi:hypothetical protein